MTDNARRVLLRVMCDRPKNAHTIARVLARPDGVMVEFREAIGDLTGKPWHWRIVPLRDPQRVNAYIAWCPACRRQYSIGDMELAAAVDTQRKVIVQDWDGPF